MTDEADRKLLLRLLAGELSPGERRRLEERLSGEAALRAARDRLAALWSALDAADEPAPAEPPALFADEVMARVRGAGGPPGWVRLAAAAALVTGIGLGIGIARQEPLERGLLYEPTVADRYLEALAAIDEEEMP